MVASDAANSDVGELADLVGDASDAASSDVPGLIGSDDLLSAASSDVGQLADLVGTADVSLFIQLFFFVVAWLAYCDV